MIIKKFSFHWDCASEVFHNFCLKTSSLLAVVLIFFYKNLKFAFYIISKYLRLEGTSSSNPLIRGGSTRAGCSGPCPVVFWISPKMDNLLHIWASCSYVFFQSMCLFWRKGHLSLEKTSHISFCVKNKYCYVRFTNVWKRFEILTPRRKIYIRAKKRNQLFFGFNIIYKMKKTKFSLSPPHPILKGRLLILTFF